MDVISPGALPGSVAFPIAPRDALILPTTFSYDSDDFLNTFIGTIEHRGSVFFDQDSIEVGDFTIGFDMARAGTLLGEASGFFVRSNVGPVQEVLFDIRNPSELQADPTTLLIAGDLLVSPEFSQVIQMDNNLAGVDAGDVQVDAIATPEPVAGVSLAAVLGALGWMSARRSARCWR